jgi:16S rRNA (guanine966-N2)-methyltransferase
MRIIAGTHKNLILKTPKGLLTRPTASQLRETLFNICQGYVEGCRFLDLFAGSGAIGFEALSRGAASCTFVDKSRESLRCMQMNEKHFPDGRATLICGDVLVVLRKFIKMRQQFDIIYVDPPYEAIGNQNGKSEPLSLQILHMIDQNALLAENGFLFIEDVCSFSQEPEAWQSLKFVNSRSAGRATLTQFCRRSKVKQLDIE